MMIGTHRISCTEGCPDRLRLMSGNATHVARQHVEETGHACIVTPLEGDERTLVDERTASDAAKSGAGRDRDEVESAGRTSSQAASQR